jgi:hypothetical protein
VSHVHVWWCTHAQHYANDIDVDSQDKLASKSDVLLSSVREGDEHECGGCAHWVLVCALGALKCVLCAARTRHIGALRSVKHSS